MSILKGFWARNEAGGWANAAGGDVVPLTQRPCDMRGVVIVKIFASWCPHCQAAAPIFRQYAAKTNGIVFAELEYETNPAPVEGLVEVTAYPTFVLFRDGKQEDIFTGFSEDKLRHMISEAQKMLLSAAHVVCTADGVCTLANGPYSYVRGDEDEG